MFAAVVAACSAAVATSALAADTFACAACTRSIAARSYTDCDACARRSQKLTGPMIWPFGSSNGGWPGGAGKLKPKLALLMVWLVQLGTADTCGRSDARDCVTRAWASLTRYSALCTAAVRDAASRAASPSDSRPGTPCAGVGVCAVAARTAKASNAARSDNAAPSRRSFEEFAFMRKAVRSVRRASVRVVVEGRSAG